MRIRLALAGGLLLVVVGLAVALSSSDPRPLSTNYVPESAEALTLRGSDRHCQEGQVVPEGAAALRLLVGTYGRPSPTLTVRVRADGGRVTAGRLPAGGEQGRISIPIASVDRTRADTTVCIAARSPEGRRTVLYGRSGQVSFEWMPEGSESWFGLAPDVADRFGLGKANPIGSWLLPFTALLFLGAAGVAVRVTARELRA